MSAEYTRDVLKVVVAKICQTIGWHSIQTTPLEIMVDLLRRYISELTRLTQAYSTQFGHTQPNLDELGLAFRDMHINIADLEEYVRYVESTPPIEVPLYPVKKESHLNFLKPGSKEVVTRPVHIHEHLPPMLPEAEENEVASTPIKQEETTTPLNAENGTPVFKRPADISPIESVTKRPRLVMEEEGRPTREISSVMMTTSGFLSPAREGKLPEARTPVTAMDSPCSSVSHGILSTNEPRFERKGPKMMKDLKKVEKRKDKLSKELFKPDEITKKVTTMKDVVKLNKQKASAANNHANRDTSHVNSCENGPVNKPQNSKALNLSAKPNKVQQKALKLEKPFAPSPTPPIPKVTAPPPDKVVDGKLSTEPDKLKLNIFKKISKVKEDKVEKVEKVKVKEEPRPIDSIKQESRESSPDLIIDESDLKSNWDHGSKQAVKTELKQEPPEKPKINHSNHPNHVLDASKIYDLIKSPHSEKDFMYDDDMSPPGTPSTPKTPEMPSHSPPQKIEKEKRKRKEKNKLKTSKPKVPKHNIMSPRRMKSEILETELDRPKTPDGPIHVKDDIPMPLQPVVPPGFPFFPGFIPGPGLIPTPMTANPLFPRMPLTTGLAKHGFGQPAHITPAMPALAFVPPVKPPVEEIVEKPLPPAPADPPVKTDKLDVAPPSKEKHKKDKKDKIKKKNKKDKVKNRSEKKKLKEEKKEKEKEKIKKEKREKKKEREHEGSVPKLTLKIGSPRPPTPDAQVARKIMIKPVVKKEEEPVQVTATTAAQEKRDREPSPELARISALITRPPKLKASSKTLTVGCDSGLHDSDNLFLPCSAATVIDKSPRQSSNPHESPFSMHINTKLKKSMLSKTFHKMKSRELKREEPTGVTDNSHSHNVTMTTVISPANPVVAPAAFYFDNDGNKVWICPACGGQDDGSPMIGCDDCDAWYHWVCVGIQVPPDDSEDWYCRICIVKKQETLQMDKKKKRKKKERKEH